MANAYDASAGTFSVQRLRTADAAYLQGVDRPATLPEPVAVARGPFITGPQANLIGNSDIWACGAAVPALPDVVWVMVNADAHLRLPAGADVVERIFLFPRGVVTNAAYLEGPQLGPGTNVATLACASGGTCPYVCASNTARDTARGLFLPLDPSFTRLGWDVVTIVECTAAGGGIAQNAARLDLLEVRLVGYPANAWGTGGLQAVAAFRGS